MCLQLIERKFCSNLKILENLNDQRQSGSFCDFTLRTQDGGSFFVHKAVIAAASLFFDAKFRNTEFGNCTSDSLELPEVSKDVLGKIIEFMYTSETTISSESAKEMLDTALFLGLNSLVDGCTEVLIETVNLESCFDLLEYSETYHRGEKLTQKCIEVILKNVQVTINLLGFSEISFDGMIKLVSFDRNKISEDSICLAAIKWISFDLAQRTQYIQSLLDAVDFGKLSHEFCLENLYKSNPLLDNTVFLRKLVEIQQKNLQLLVEHEKGKTPISLSETETEKQERMCSLQRKVYAVLNDKMHLFTGREENLFQTITEIETRRFGYTNFSENNFFVCGGKIDDVETKSSKYYSFEENCWKKLPPMTVARWNHRAVNFNNRIYVCGGYAEKTVEIFDVNKICWTEGPCLPQDMYSFGLCTLDSCIYAIRHENIYCMDTRKNNWTTLSTSCSTQNEYCSSIAFDNFIYKFDYEEINKFDLRNKKWIEEEKKLHQKEFNQLPHCCQLDDKFYLFGTKRFNVRNYKYSLEMYNARTLELLQSYHSKVLKFLHVHALFATDN